MTFEFRPAKREHLPLLIGLAGYTGSGKTYSGMLLAKGLAGGKPFAVIDTENGRASHYADDFTFESADLREPFRPERYSEAILDADKAGYPVILVDSFSHEYAGDGGLLDWAEDELQRLAGDDWKKREAMAAGSWIKPKRAHKQMMSRLLQVRAHIVLCFRAEEKIEFVKEPDQNGKMKTVVRPKRTLTGGSLDGWIPITEKTVPYEMTASFLLSPSNPGVPKPIKLEAKHRPFFPLDQPISEESGRLLAGWAAGGSSEPGPKAASPVSDAPIGERPPGSATPSSVELADRLLNIVAPEKVAGVLTAIEAKKATLDEAALCTWLARQVRNAESVRDSEPVAS